jgi:hypothetical protein
MALGGDMEREQVECVECGHGRLHDRDDCTPVEFSGQQAYLCSRCTRDYTCRLCWEAGEVTVEYSLRCKASGMCETCAAGFTNEEIVDRFEAAVHAIRGEA